MGNVIGPTIVFKARFAETDKLKGQVTKAIKDATKGAPPVKVNLKVSRAGGGAGALKKSLSGLDKTIKSLGGRFDKLGKQITTALGKATKPAEKFNDPLEDIKITLDDIKGNDAMSELARRLLVGQEMAFGQAEGLKTVIKVAQQMKEEIGQLEELEELQEGFEALFQVTGRFGEEAADTFNQIGDPAERMRASVEGAAMALKLSQTPVARLGDKVLLLKGKFQILMGLFTPFAFLLTPLKIALAGAAAGFGLLAGASALFLVKNKRTNEEVEKLTRSFKAMTANIGRAITGGENFVGVLKVLQRWVKMVDDRVVSMSDAIARFAAKAAIEVVGSIQDLVREFGLFYIVLKMGAPVFEWFRRRFDQMINGIKKTWAQFQKDMLLFLSAGDSDLQKIIQKVFHIPTLSDLNAQINKAEHGLKQAGKAAASINMGKAWSAAQEDVNALTNELGIMRSAFKKIEDEGTKGARVLGSAFDKTKKKARETAMFIESVFDSMFGIDMLNNLNRLAKIELDRLKTLKEMRTSVFHINDALTKTLALEGEITFQMSKARMEAQRMLEIRTTMGGGFRASFEDTLGITKMQDGLLTLKTFGEVMADLGKNVGSVVANSFVELGSSVAGAFGEMAAGVMTLKAFGDSILDFFGNLASQIGKFFIQTGIGMLFIDPFAGAGLMAAGLALSFMGGILGGKGSGNAKGSGGGRSSKDKRQIFDVDRRFRKDPEERQKSFNIEVVIAGEQIDRPMVNIFDRIHRLNRSRQVARRFRRAA